MIEQIRRILSPEFGIRLASALATAAKLDRQIADLSLAAESGDAEARRQCEKLEEEQRAVEQTIKRLQHAERQAAQRERAAEAKAAAQAQRSKFKLLEQHAHRREAAAQRLSAALEQACAAYGDFLAHTEAMVHGLPTGCTWPPAYATHLSRNEPAVADCMYKSSGVHKIGQRGSIFPASKPLSEFNRYQPEKCSSFAEVIAASNAYLLQAVNSQVAIAETVSNEVRAA
jgi:exonuclease VII large subunit